MYWRIMWPKDCYMNKCTDVNEVFFYPLHCLTLTQPKLFLFYIVGIHYIYPYKNALLIIYLYESKPSKWSNYEQLSE